MREIFISRRRRVSLLALGSPTVRVLCPTLSDPDFLSPTRIGRLDCGLGYICILDVRVPSKTAILLCIPAEAVHLPRRTLLICSMATCSRAATMDSLCGVVAMQPKDMWSQVIRVLHKLLDLPPSLLKKFLSDERVHPLSRMETAMNKLPELCQDVLMDIFANLEIPDLMRAASVCSSWRSAYTSLRNVGKYKSQTPCLLYTSESSGQNVACLYSLAERRVYKLTLPEPPIRSRTLIGSSNGWLITADERSELHLVNPITGQQIPLPSVVTIEHVKPVTDGSGIIHRYQLSYHTTEEVHQEPSLHALKDLREHLYYKAFMFPDSSTGSYIVVLIHNPYYQLSFARAGDINWTWLPSNIRYRDCMYIDGLLYAVTSLGEIHAFDLTASIVTMTVIIDKSEPLIHDNMYIIKAPWGDLLQVWRFVDAPEQVDGNGDTSDHGSATHLLCTLKVNIYKVDLEAKMLEEIKRLPYHMLFLGYNNSLCVSAEGHPQLMANHIYFTDDYDEKINAFKNDPRDTRDIGVLNLETGSRQEIVSQMWSNWPCPTWITPNFTKMGLVSDK